MGYRQIKKERKLTKYSLLHICHYKLIYYYNKYDVVIIITKRSSQSMKLKLR